jgi:fibronectin-binding autotransporter adhesin
MTHATNTTIANNLYAVANATVSSNPFVWQFLDRDPTFNDVNYPIQKLWLNTTNNGIWFLKNFITTNGIVTANWIFVATGGQQFQSLSDTANTVVFPSPSSGAPPNNIQLVGGTGIDIVSDPAANLLTFSVSGSGVVEQFSMQTGTTPIGPTGGIVTFDGAVVSSGTHPVRTDGTGPSTMTLEVQTSQAIASTNASNIGLAAFNSSEFTVDANGFVSVIGGPPTTNFTVDANTAPGTNPVLPNGAGNVTITGGQVAAGTTANVIRTDSLAANEFAIQVQRSQAVAVSTVGDNGVSHFNSASFTVDSNGFVSLSGSAVGETITGNTGGPLSPTAGNWNILGATVAAGTAPLVTAGSGSTLTINAQRSQAIASTNATNVGLAAFNSAQFSVDANGYVSLTGSVPGSLETLSDDVATSITPSAGNIQLVGHVNEQGSTKFSTVVAGTNLANINPMSPARWIVDALGFNGTHTTITSATASATAGDTILILPGTYTENFTAKAGVNYTALPGDGYIGNVIILGNVTCTGAGAFQFSSVQLQTNSANCLTVSGSSATIVQLDNVYINCTNNTGISYTTTNTASNISFVNCTYKLETTGIAYYSMSSTGFLNHYRCDFENNGASTTVSSNSAGGVGFWNCVSNSAFGTTGTGFLMFQNCALNSTTNTTPIQISTSFTAPLSSVYNCYVFGGTSPAITINGGVVLNLFNSVVYSSNANAITGTGGLQYGLVSFPFAPTPSVGTEIPSALSLPQGGTGNTSATPYALQAGGTTSTGVFQSINPGSAGQILQCGGSATLPTWVNTTAIGNLVLIQSQLASASASLVFTTGITSTYNNYLLLVSNYLPSTTATDLLIQISTNSGVSYLNSGYLSGFLFGLYNSASLNNFNLTTGMLIAHAVTGTSAVSPTSAVIWLDNLTSGSGYPTSSGQATGNFSSATMGFATTAGVYNTGSTTVNALKVLSSSGNLGTGRFTLYGILE